MKKILPWLLSLSCFGLAILIALKFSSTSDGIEQRIYSDLSEAQIKNEFPKEFESLKSIRILIHSKEENLRSSLKNVTALPFSENANGTHSIQIDVIENFEPINEAQIILQFNLFENQTRNKVWESSRLYKLNEKEATALKKNTY